jgi:hypothetical protein
LQDKDDNYSGFGFMGFDSWSQEIYHYRHRTVAALFRKLFGKKKRPAG